MSHLQEEGRTYSDCGAMDLSSSKGSSKGGNTEDDSEEEEVWANNSRKRKADQFSDGEERRKRGRKEEEDQSSFTKETVPVRNRRRNIQPVMDSRNLDYGTRTAQAEEEARRERLVGATHGLMQDSVPSQEDPQGSGLATHREIVRGSGSDSDGLKEGLESEESDDEDPNNSGLHVMDSLNVRNDEGQVLVNIGHPEDESPVFLAPQLAATAKPHQIGGIRFLYDNIIESQQRFSTSQGFGCILAHSMGLGKTFQVVSFTDIFLSSTSGKKVLCIVPINTIQNWLSEFNYWLPEADEPSPLSTSLHSNIRPRSFPVLLLNDSLKNLQQRAAVIHTWQTNGGVLLMGYELYRQLANKKPKKKKTQGLECIDLEEEDRTRSILTEIQSSLVSPGPDLVICDEGHRIKNSHASISQALKQIKTKRRIVLTGYPLQNNLMEYWCMVDFVRPNYLGNKTEFSNMFERPIQNGQCVDSTSKDVRLMKHRAHVLHEQLKGFVQRRGHIVLRDSLPPKTEHVLCLRMTDTQRKLYRRFMEELITNRCVSNPLKAFAVCCKIWNHPDVLYNFMKKKADIDLDWDSEELVLSSTTSSSSSKGRGMEDAQSHLPFARKEEINYDWAQGMLQYYTPHCLENSNKLQVFLAILESSIEVGDRILLFSQSLFTLNLIEDFLQKKELTNCEEPWKLGETYYRLDGSTSSLERDRLITDFNSNQKVKLFLVSTRAGSLGVNLVGANRVVIFDASWNPCHDTQAVCRVYRYGQTKATYVYRLVTDNSLEKKIYDRQVNKQGMADRIVDEMNPDAHLSSKEVHSLICEEEDDPPPPTAVTDHEAFPDPVMRAVLSEHGARLTKLPFAHESLLVDRKDSRLSRAEKKLAERSYSLERTSKITYSRPSYAAFYPKPGMGPNTNIHQPGSRGNTRNRYFDQGRPKDNWIPPTAAPAPRPVPRPVASVRPMQPLAQDPDSQREGGCPEEHVNSSYPTPTFGNVLSGPPSPPASTRPAQDWTIKKPDWQPPDRGRLFDIFLPGDRNTNTETPNCNNSALQSLRQQGLELQTVVVPRDLTIPTGHNSPPVFLNGGSTVMVIKTLKGIYLRLEEKIIKIKQPAAVQGLLGLEVGPRGGEGWGCT